MSACNNKAVPVEGWSLVQTLPRLPAGRVVTVCRLKENSLLMTFFMSHLYMDGKEIRLIEYVYASEHLKVL